MSYKKIEAYNTPLPFRNKHYINLYVKPLYHLTNHKKMYLSDRQPHHLYL